MLFPEGYCNTADHRFYL